jgi:hypothetical protein
MQKETPQREWETMTLKERTKEIIREKRTPQEITKGDENN